MRRIINSMKRILSFAMVAAIAFSLVACGANDGKKSENTSASTASQGKTNESVKLKIAIKDAQPTDATSMKLIEEIEKGMAAEGKNVDLELVAVPQGNYAEKLTLMIIGGDVPDIMYFQGGDDKISSQGLLEDLRPYIGKSTHIKAALEPFNQKRMENYPYLLYLSPARVATPVIRKDWFEQLSTSKELLDNPTIDNYYAFFKEIKNKSFEGGANPQFAITVAGDIAELDTIFNVAFGITSTWMKDDKGQYVYKNTTQNYKEKLAFYSKLVKEGLLDKEYLTKKWDTKEQAFYEKKSGVIVGTSGKVIDVYNTKMTKVNTAQSELIILPPAKGKEQGYMPVDTVKEGRGFAVSSKSKNKGIAFQVLEYMCSPKGQLLDKLGFENTHYVVKDNKIQLTDKFSEWYPRFWESLKTFNPNPPLGAPIMAKPAFDSLDMVKKYFKEDTTILIPQELIANWDSMQKLDKEFSANAITGKAPVDDFDKFVQGWYKAGGTELTKYANEKLK